jgi:SSS family solute:Na+ symporter
MGTVFFLVALAFSKITGVDTIWMIWILGIVVIFITLIGGIEAVIWLDVIQGFMLVIGGIVALGILIFTTPGGFDAIWQTAEAGNRIGFGPFDFEFINLTFWVMVLNGLFYAIQKYGTDQTIVQRYLTAKSDKQAVKASFIGVLTSVPVWALFMFIGTALFSYYQLSGDVLPDGIKNDEVFPHFIITKFPIGVIGLVLSALLAAAISSLDSDLNCLSAIFVKDYYLRIKKQATEKQQVFASKAVVIIAGLTAIAIAWYYTKIGGEGALGVVFNLYAIFSGGIAGMFLLGIFIPKANKQGVYIGILASVIFTAWAVLTSTSVESGDNKHLMLNLGNYNYTHNKMMLGVYSHVVLFVVGIISSYFFKSTVNIDKLTYIGWLKAKKNNINT